MRAPRRKPPGCVLRAFGLAPALKDKPFYVSEESGERTYVGRVGEDGTISELKLFTERGGESIAVDDHGNIYIAAGQIFVYNSSGNLIDTIDVPERPLQLLFGEKDKSALFILTHSSLYRVATRYKGQ